MGFWEDGTSKLEIRFCSLISLVSSCVIRFLEYLCVSEQWVVSFIVSTF